MPKPNIRLSKIGHALVTTYLRFSLTWVEMGLLDDASCCDQLMLLCLEFRLAWFSQFCLGTNLCFYDRTHLWGFITLLKMQSFLLIFFSSSYMFLSYLSKKVDFVLKIFVAIWSISYTMWRILLSFFFCYGISVTTSDSVVLLTLCWFNIKRNFIVAYSE